MGFVTGIRRMINDNRLGKRTNIRTVRFRREVNERW
jgi:hypothetical protein